jgi:gamma-glutamyl:cysteine ligase YbdK (ATP-grasp superfamily)
MAKRGSRFVDDVLRKKSPRAQQQRQEQRDQTEVEPEVSEQVDGFLDDAMEGLAGLRAALGVLSDDGGDDETAPDGVEEALDVAAEALSVLREEIDQLLEDHGLEPTSATEVAADE